jgi:hypothetical protein
MTIGLSGVLFVVFLVLKLCGVIAWSWWWVTAPLWGGAALALAGAAFIALVAVSVRERYR